MIDWLITQQEYVDGQVEKSTESAQGTLLPTIINTLKNREITAEKSTKHQDLLTCLVLLVRTKSDLMVENARNRINELYTYYRTQQLYGRAGVEINYM